jgi:hypothetical protein
MVISSASVFTYLLTTQLISFFSLYLVMLPMGQICWPSVKINQFYGTRWLQHFIFSLQVFWYICLSNCFAQVPWVCQVLAYMLSSLPKCPVLRCLHGCSIKLVFNQLSYLHEMLDNGAFLHVFSIQFFLTCEVKSVCTCTFVFGCEIQSWRLYTQSFISWRYR